MKKKIWTLGALILFVMFVAESFLYHYIADHVPVPEDSVSYDNFVRFVRSQRGPVWITTKPWVSIEAGKNSYMALQQMAGEWAGGNPDDPIPPDLMAAIEAKKFSMIVIGEEFVRPWLWPSLAARIGANYKMAGRLPPEMTIRQFDGSSMAPHYVFVAK